MQRVDGEALYQVAQSHYEIIGTVSVYDGTYNYIDIRLLVGVHTAFVQQFLYDIREFLWQRLTYLRTSVLRRYVLAYLYQLVKGNYVPIYKLGLHLFYQQQFLFGVIYQCAELFFLALAQSVSEYLVHLSLYGSRGISQYVLKRFILSVKVGQEVLSTFRKIKYRFQIYYLRTGGCYGREVMR